MTYISAASMGFNNAARVACRNTNGFIGVGKRRNVASIQTYACFSSRHEPSIANHKTEIGASATPWRGISHCSINDEVPLPYSSNENTSLLSEMSRIRFVGVLLEEDDGG